MKKKQEFFIDKFLEERVAYHPTKNYRFDKICTIVRDALTEEWSLHDDRGKISTLEREKNAIIGKEEAVSYYKEKIKSILRERNLSGEAFPEYYPSLIEGVFHENWGLAGLAPWAYDSTEAYKNSSSAKIIGNRLYCLIDGVEELQEQRLSDRRRLQLKKALLLGTPEERLEAGFHEVYLQNGIRVTIYSGERTKDGQDVMVFRKYVLKELTFENMAAFGTIPKECIPLLYAMTEIGFNVLFSGQVRSGKTTFMICWQKYEDIRLEGLAIATDPETPWHEIMPDAPIMQIVADGEDLARITKSLLRGDNDYVLLEEMRDATAFNLALDITSTGTQRSKGTIHTNKAADIPYKMASKIIAKYGGDLNAVISQVFQNFNYVLEFFQVSTDKAQKRLKGISEFRYDEQKDECSIHRICDYSYEADSWTFVYDIGEDKRQLGLAYPESMKKMETVLEHLAKKYPCQKEHVLKPAYYKSDKYRKGKEKGE